MSPFRTVPEARFAKNYGIWLRDTRMAMKLSLEAMGDEAGVHRNTVWRWERGKSMPNAFQYELIRKLVKSALHQAAAK